MYDVFVNIQLFYKFGIRYRQYLFNFTTNMCELFSPNRKTINKRQELFNYIVQKVVQNVTFSCPWKKTTSHTNISADDILKSVNGVFKLILPAGDHKWVLKYYSSKNLTYYEVSILTTMKALNGSDISMLSMG